MSASKSSLTIKNKHLIKLLVFVYFFLIALKHLSGYSQIIYIIPFLGVILFWLLEPRLKRDKLLPVFYVWSTFFFLMSLLSLSWSEFRSVYYLSIGLSAFVVGYVFFIYPRYALKFSFSLLIVFNVFILVSVFLSTEPPAVTLNELFPLSSRNLVGAMTVFLQMFYTASYYRVHKKLPKFLLLISLLIIVISFGRASILAGLLLVFIYLSFYAHKSPWLVGLGFVLTLFLFIVIGLNGFLISVDDYLNQYSNFQRGIDSPRLDIISEYAHTTSLLTFITGHSILDSSTASLLDGNPHNSYIRAHSYFGIASLLFLIFLLFILIAKVRSRTWLYFSLIIVYLFRAIFEPIALFDIYDFLFFYLVFLVSLSGKNVRYDG